MNLNIIFEDNCLLIINKPSGVDAQKLVEGINKDFHVVHRLDQRVSGLMIIAKNKETAGILSEMLADRKIQKKYQAIVSTKPENDDAHLVSYIQKIGTAKAKVSSENKRNFKKAELLYKVVASSEKYHLLDIELITGRFHQIRAQLSHIGSPVLGDLKYGYKRSSPDGSLFLQSYFISFPHPISKESLTFEIEKPEIWQKYGF